MSWGTRFLRGDRVWVKLDPSGQPAAGTDGRVDVRYRPGGKIYRASSRNLSPDPTPEVIPDDDSGGPGSGLGSKPASASAPASGSSSSSSSRPIQIWTDGACSGNPGPMGVGIVLVDGTDRKELSEYLGSGTNNIAELTAIVRALEESPRDRTVIVHSDSAYALGLLGKGWRAKANQELVERMRELAREFSDLRLVKVAGHAGVPENERADELAREAVQRRK